MKGRVRLDVVVAVAILIGLIVANATVYAPKRRQLDDVTGNLELAEKELRYVAGHSDALGLVAGYLPSEAEEPGNQRFLEGASAEIDRLGLALSRIEPKGETPYGEYVKRSYKMQIEGSYEGLASFFEYIEGLSDVVIVEGFDYRSSAVSRNSRHRASVSISVIGY